MFIGPRNKDGNPCNLAPGSSGMTRCLEPRFQKNEGGGFCIVDNRNLSLDNLSTSLYPGPGFLDLLHLHPREGARNA